MRKIPLPAIVPVLYQEERLPLYIIHSGCGQIFWVVDERFSQTFQQNLRAPLKNFGGSPPVDEPVDWDRMSILIIGA